MEVHSSSSTKYTRPSKQHSALTDGQNKNSTNYRVLFNFPELFN